MAATGLFLCTFLIGHLAGNLQLMLKFSPESAAQFNDYAYFMTHNIFIKVLSYVTYISILFHAVDGILLAVANKKARPIGYAMSNPSANSSWSSRNMAMLGTLILAFIIMHMAQFWGRMHFGELPTYKMEGKEIKDLYSIVIYFYKQEGTGLVWCFVYLIGMIALAFHLMHGVQSAFQSVGLRHAKYTPKIKSISMGFAILVPALFALIPFWIHFVLEVDPRWLEYMSK